MLILSSKDARILFVPRCINIGKGSCQSISDLYLTIRVTSTRFKLS